MAKVWACFEIDISNGNQRKFNLQFSINRSDSIILSFVEMINCVCVGGCASCLSLVHEMWYKILTSPILLSIYRKEVLKEYDSIQNGIGTPDLYLAICLAVAWIVIVSVLIGGVQSSGKASYFLGIVYDYEWWWFTTTKMAETMATFNRAHRSDSAVCQ